MQTFTDAVEIMQFSRKVQANPLVWGRGSGGKAP